MFPPAEWTQEMFLKQLALMIWKLRTQKGPGGWGWVSGLALIAQGQEQSEVSLPLGLGTPSRYPDSWGHCSASMEMNPSFLTPPAEGPGPGHKK